MIKLNVILLLDDISRRNIKVDITELALSGVHVVYNFKDITEEMLKETKTVVILEYYPGTAESFNNLKLYKEVMKLNYIYLGKNKSYLTFMELISKCYEMDISDLDYYKLQAVIVEDEATINRNLVSESDMIDEIKEYAEKVIDNSVTLDEDEVMLAKGYLEIYKSNKYANELVQVFKQEVEKTRRSLIRETSKSEQLQNSYMDIVEEAQRVSENLKQYEVILSKNVYDKVIKDNYEKPPFIMYIKEYEELIHFDSFLWTISNTLKYQYRKSVKVLKLYDNSISKRLPSLSKGYKVMGNEFKVSDVQASDYIVKVGDHMGVLNTLLTNSVNLDVLIIVDCKNHNDMVCIGNDIVFNTCRNYNNFECYGITDINTICNNEREYPLSWDTYKEYRRLKTLEDKLVFLSSRDIIMNMLKNIEISMGGF